MTRADHRLPDTRESASSVDLSVIIPCYNSAATLAAQLSALAGQKTTYCWEVVVADNGSTDNTRAAATVFGDRIPHLHVVDASARRGAAHARNTGAHAAN